MFICDGRHSCQITPEVPKRTRWRGGARPQDKRGPHGVRIPYPSGNTRSWGHRRSRTLWNLRSRPHTWLSRSTGGVVEPIYLRGDLDYSDLQRDDGPIECRDVCVESLYLGDGIEAMHGLIKSGR